LQKKLWASKVAKVSILGILGLQLGNLRKKWQLGVGPVARHKKYYKGEGGGFPQVRDVVNLMSLCLLWFVRAPKELQLCTNQLVVWFVQVRVSNWLTCHSS
jgi:hypothetical protein